MKLDQAVRILAVHNHLGTCEWECWLGLADRGVAFGGHHDYGEPDRRIMLSMDQAIRAAQSYLDRDNDTGRLATMTVDVGAGLPV
jgi:hypothetical protein